MRSRLWKGGIGYMQLSGLKGRPFEVLLDEAIV